MQISAGEEHLKESSSTTCADIHTLHAIDGHVGETRGGGRGWMRRRRRKRRGRGGRRKRTGREGGGGGGAEGGEGGVSQKFEMILNGAIFR